MTSKRPRVDEPPKVDPITLEIIRYGLQSIPDEIEADIARTAYSPLVYEYKDYAVGMVAPNGETIAQCRGGIPLFLANALGVAIREGVEVYGKDFERGDVVISNRAATFGQHLNNVIMYTPVFDGPDGSRLVGFVAILVHWTDVGGRYVGSSASNDTTEIFQEGIQFHTVKLRRRGEPVHEIYRMIESNTRLPELVLGDIEAQLAGCLKGANLFEEFVGKFGVEVVQNAVETIWSQTEALARAAVRAIPDGTYRGTSFLDNDGVDLDRKILIDITVKVEGERFIVDFSNVAKEVRGPFNSGRFGGGITAARIAFKYLTTPGEMTNEGSFKPLEVILPDGTFLSASATAALARYSIPLPTVIDTIVQAVAQATSNCVAAGHHAAMGSHRFQGISPKTDRLFSHLDTAHGGWGASLGRDGAGPFKTMAHGDTLDVPIEVQESLYPLVVDYLGFLSDSGGAGQQRGGLGLQKGYTVQHPCKLTLTFERFGCPAWGLAGGGPGKPGFVEIQRRGSETRDMFLKATDIPLVAGDRIFIRTGGGGGYGNPLERSPKDVSSDVKAGYVTVRGALAEYGVVVGSLGEVDEAATLAERSKRALSRSAA